MPLLDPRDIVAFPAGDNTTDTVINGVHFNLTTLDHWNYTLYSNGTLSNGSWCVLTFAPHTPSLLLENGTFANVTWCYEPVRNIGTRAGIAIGYAVAFGVGLVITLVCLNKHGRLHLPAEKRFYPIGRRWQWYWASWVCAMALISLMTSVDVDRYYLPELPIILTSFFWYLMQIGAVAIVWEAVRHWGSWMERQFIDPDPFALRDDDRRSKVEFWVPLWFYLFLWLNFFMIIPRNWEPIQHQRYPQQILDEAIPTATDARFKAAAFFLAVCWLTTVFSLRHSIKHYCPRNRGIFNRVAGFLRYTPARFILIVPLAAVIPAYQALVAWHFAWSPLNANGLVAAIYPGAFTPALLIVYIQAFFGLLLPNEDKELRRQRRVRGQELDREMGIVNKPAWWRLVNGENIAANESMRDRLTRNVREINGNKSAAAATPAAGASGPVEMTPVPPPPPSGPTVPRPVAQPYAGKSDRRRQERAVELAAGMLFPEAGERAAAASASRRAEATLDGPPPPPYQPERDVRADAHTQAPNVARSISGDSTNRPPQQIRSMLDV
ncbi:Pheromone a factor receptor [Madurella fahalii]|uniref:Pheromone a factor receptor n=1 Tax=Madurella fahalii TaxID=1157608 RepID=A0ABQ0GGU8_9PEZI